MIIGNYINSLDESATKPFFEDEIINLKLYDTENNYVADYQANVIEDYGNLTKFGYNFSDGFNSYFSFGIKRYGYGLS